MLVPRLITDQTVPRLSPRLTFWVSAAFVVFLYLCFVGVVPFVDRAIYELDETGGGDILKQVLFVLLGLAFAGFLAAQPQVRLRPMVTPMLVVTLGWALLSVGWSAVPDIALRRLILTLIVIFIAYAAVVLLGPRKVLDVLFYTLLSLIIISYVGLPLINNAMHMVDERGADVLAGNWRGIFIHKNVAGFACAFLIVLGFQRALFGAANQKVLAFVSIALASVFLWFSASKTSMFLLLPVLVLGTLLAQAVHSRTPSQRQTLWWLSVFFTVLFGLGLYVSVTLEFLNDPDALTGRSAIWAVVGQLIAERPVFGYGFASVYGVGMATPLLSYASGWVLLVAHAHNGYLDMLLTLGVIGFVFSLLTFIILPLRQLFLLPTVPKDILATCLCLLMFVVLHNLTETSLFDRERAQWVVLLLVAAVAQAYAIANRKPTT